MAFEIDPVKYGVLWQKIEGYESKFAEISKKQDKMEEKIEELLELANKGRGGFWVGMMIVSGISTAIGWMVHWFTGK